VYGIKKEKDVHEEMTLEPLTDYSKFKADCETILSSFHDDNFITVTLRPATVCGYSRRQRLDVVVNILTNLAYHKREISVFGGSQLRPNIHIEDMADAYMVVLDAPDEKISQKVFNVGCENHSVLELAKTVQEVVSRDVKLVVTPTDDLRSYHVSSAKILKELGFATKHTIKQASIDLVQAFEKGLLPNSLEDERYFNIKKMQSIYLE
jgi:nucleoside-diphosphate-sugar epimerase